MNKPEENPVGIFQRHKEAVKDGNSIIDALKCLGAGQIIVSRLDGAMLWRRLCREMKEKLAIHIYSDEYVGFSVKNFIILWRKT